MNYNHYRMKKANGRKASPLLTKLYENDPFSKNICLILIWNMQFKLGN